MIPTASSPWHLLGVQPTDSDATIHATYTALREQYDDAQDLYALDEAYQQIKAERTVLAYGDLPPETDVANTEELPVSQHDSHPVHIGRTQDPAQSKRKAVPSGAMPPRMFTGALDENTPLRLLVRYAQEVETPLVKGRLEQLQRDFWLGMIYKAATREMHQSNLTPHHFCRQKFGIPYERLLDCARVTDGWREIAEAQDWINSRKGKGWLVPAGTSTEYVKALLQQYRAFKNGKPPSWREDETAERRAAKAAGGPQPKPREIITQQHETITTLKVELEKARQETEWGQAGARAWKQKGQDRAALWKRKAKQERAHRLVAEAALRAAEDGSPA